MSSDSQAALLLLPTTATDSGVISNSSCQHMSLEGDRNHTQSSANSQQDLVWGFPFERSEHLKSLQWREVTSPCAHCPVDLSRAKCPSRCTQDLSECRCRRFLMCTWQHKPQFLSSSCWSGRLAEVGTDSETICVFLKFFLCCYITFISRTCVPQTFLSVNHLSLETAAAVAVH